MDRGGGGISAPLSRLTGDAGAKARSLRFDGLTGAIGEAGPWTESCPVLRVFNLSGFGPGESFRGWRGVGAEVGCDCDGGLTFMFSNRASSDETGLWQSEHGH